jgi:tetratricopeptide (TPR) repeat protein
MRLGVPIAVLVALPAAALAASLPSADAEPPQEQAAPQPPRTVSVVEQALAEIVGLLQAGRRDEAKQLLAEFVGMFGIHPVSLEIEGTLALDENRLEEAESALRKSLAAQESASATAKLGVVLLRRGDLREGRALLEKAARDPAQSFAVLQLARLDAGLGNHGAAIAQYRRLLAATPGLTPLHFELGEVYNAVGQYRETRALLAGRIEGLPPAGRAAALRLAARASIGLRDAETAEREVALLSALLPGADFALVTLAAQLDALKGNVESGARRLRAAMTGAAAQDQPLRLALARLYASAGKVRPEAADAYSEVLTAMPQDADPEPIVRELASTLMGAGDAAGAERVFEAYASRYPDRPKLAVMAASLVAARGEFAEALARLAKIEGAGAPPPELYVLRAQIQRATGKPREAMEAARRAARIDPRNISYWTTYSSLAHDVGGHKLMAEAVAEGLEANPNNPDLLFDLALAEDEDGRPDEARRKYREILKTDPQHVATLTALARNLSAAPGGAEEAKRLIAAALQLRPDDPEIKADYAMVLHRSGDNRAALAVLESLARVTPRDAMLNYRLATVYRAAGDETKARAAGRAALSAGLAGAPAEELRSWVR